VSITLLCNSLFPGDYFVLLRRKL